VDYERGQESAPLYPVIASPIPMRWTPERSRPLPGGRGRPRICAGDGEIVGGATWTISPVSLLEARFGFSRMKAGRLPRWPAAPAWRTSSVRLGGLPPQGNNSGGHFRMCISLMAAYQLGRLWTSPQVPEPHGLESEGDFTRLLPGHHLLGGRRVHHCSYVAQQDPANPVMGGTSMARDERHLLHGCSCRSGVSDTVCTDPMCFRPTTPTTEFATGESNKCSTMRLPAWRSLPRRVCPDSPASPTSATGALAAIAGRLESEHRLTVKPGPAATSSTRLSLAQPAVPTSI